MFLSTFDTMVCHLFEIEFAYFNKSGNDLMI